MDGGPILKMRKTTGAACEGKGKQQRMLRLAKLELLVKHPKGRSSRRLDREFCSSTKDTSVVVTGTQAVLKIMGMKSPRESVEV